jgi:hypothetical protein
MREKGAELIYRPAYFAIKREMAPYTVGVRLNARLLSGDAWDKAVAEHADDSPRNQDQGRREQRSILSIAHRGTVPHVAVSIVTGTADI